MADEDNVDDELDRYLKDIRRFDALAEREVVAKIVRHLGVALRNADSARVTGSDPGELARIAERWCGRKLGVANRARAASAVRFVCEVMDGVAQKSRVTFYYLVAKQLDRLDAL